jgi:hypothetical protein
MREARSTCRGTAAHPACAVSASNLDAHKVPRQTYIPITAAFFFRPSGSAVKRGRTDPTPLGGRIGGSNPFSTWGIRNAKKAKGSRWRL